MTYETVRTTDVVDRMKSLQKTLADDEYLGSTIDLYRLSWLQAEVARTPGRLSNKLISIRKSKD